MEVQIKKEVEVILVLSNREAILLKTYVQNGYEDEEKEIKDLRRDLFNTLPSFDELRQL